MIVLTLASGQQADLAQSDLSGRKRPIAALDITELTSPAGDARSADGRNRNLCADVAATILSFHLRPVGQWPQRPLIEVLHFSAPERYTPGTFSGISWAGLQVACRLGGQSLLILDRQPPVLAAVLRRAGSAPVRLVLARSGGYSLGRNRVDRAGLLSRRNRTGTRKRLTEMLASLARGVGF